MTVLGAWPDATKKAELGQAKNVTDYAGVRLAADAAIWIHSVLNSLTTGRECFVSPRVPLTSVVDRVASRALPWKKAGAQLLVLLETKRPALKQITRQERDDARVAAEKAYKERMAEPLPDDEGEKQVRIEELREMRKQAAFCREDLYPDIMNRLKELDIPCMMCHREFDHQVVVLHMQGLIDGGITTDVDPLFIGLPFIITDINTSTGACVQYDRATFLPGITDGVAVDGESDNYGPSLVAGIAGNDYHDGIPGWRVKSANKPAGKILKESVPNRSRALSALCAEHQRKPNAPVGIHEGIKSAMSMFQFGPSFVVLGDSDGTDVSASSFDLFASIRSGGLRVRTGHLREELAPRGWRTLTKEPNDRTTDDGASDIALLKINMNTGVAFEKLSPPLAADGAELPYGAMLDAPAEDVEKEDPWTIDIWLRSRGLVAGNDDDAGALARKIIELGDAGPQPLPASCQVCCGPYSAFEPFVSEPVTWLRGQDAIDAMREHMPHIDEAWFAKVWSTQKNGSRNRILALTRGGNILTDTIEFAMLHLRDANKTAVAVFSVGCCPSQRDESYRLYTAFAEGKFLPFPVSSCSCKVGRFFCCHVLAFLLLARLVVVHSVDHAELVDLFETTKEVRQSPLPVGYYYGRGAGTVRDEATAVKRELEGVGGGPANDDAERAAEEEDETGSKGAVVDMCAEVDRILKEGRVRKAARGAAGDGNASAKKLDVGRAGEHIQSHMGTATSQPFTDLQDEVLERIDRLAKGAMISKDALITEYASIYADERQARLHARGADAWRGGPGLNTSSEPRPRGADTHGETKKRRYCTVS